MQTNFAPIDWTILAVVLGTICVVAYTTKKYTRSVADFLVANRCAGKYLLSVADGIAGLGAVSVVAFFEMYYKAGFSGIWWGTMMLPVGVILSLTGWVQYRYRETRVLTMAQFMEIRYSRNFRVFAGIMCFISGALNFGVFPAVGGHFFQYYCGLPPYMVDIGFTEIDLVFGGIMAVLLIVSLAFTFMGGQIAVIVTDFLQGTFCNIAFCIIAAYLVLFHFDWSDMLAAFQAAPEDASLINPARSGSTENFNAFYFLIGLFGYLVNTMAWQGNQGYNASARTPHAARMGRVIGALRPFIQTLTILLLAVGAYTVLHHSNYAEDAAHVQSVLDTIENPKLQSQQTVTVALTRILPVGLLGLFGAVMMAAFISTHDTYLHSWGSIFIQDVFMPIRQMVRGDNEPMAPRAHLTLLRFSIIGVAIFIFLFSLLVPQKLDVLMFFALTGNIYLGWAGWTIVGGLYTSVGNTAGAWVAAIVGFFLAIGGWFFTFQWPFFQGCIEGWFPGLWEKGVESGAWFAGEAFPLNAQVLYFWLMVITGICYIGVSAIASKGQRFNMDRMLHRGEYAIEGDSEVPEVRTGFQTLKMTSQFKFDDKVLYISSLGYTLFFLVVFLVGTIAFAVFQKEISDVFWGKLWWGYIVFMLTAGTAITVWVTIGGVINLKQMFALLRTVERDEDDDGTVVGHQSLADLPEDGEEVVSSDNQ